MSAKTSAAPACPPAAVGVAGVEASVAVIRTEPETRTRRRGVRAHSCRLIVFVCVFVCVGVCVYACVCVSARACVYVGVAGAGVCECALIRVGAACNICVCAGVHQTFMCARVCNMRTSIRRAT